MIQFLFLSLSALAQETAQKSGASGPSIWESTLIPMGAFFLIFFFLVIRPQARKAKQAQEFMGALKKGDQVLTSGGILGTIVGVSENFVDLKASDSTKIKVLKGSLSPYLEAKAKS